MARYFLSAAINHPGVGVQILAKGHVRWRDCVLHPTGWGRKTGNALTMQIPVDHRDDYSYDVFDEVWVGVLDEDNHWTQVLFGGLVLRMVTKSIGGAEREVRLELVSYDYELSHVSVPSWPTADLNETPTGRSGAPVIKGFRPNLPNSSDNPLLDGVDLYDGTPEATVHTARQWVEATLATVPDTDRGGLMPAHTHGFIMGDMGAWDDSIGNMRITFEVRPSNSNVPGHISTTTLEDAIQQVMDATSFAAISRGYDPILPAFYMEPIVNPDDPTKVTARLRVIDLLAPTAVTEHSEADWYFTTDRPLPATAHRYWNASMEIDASLFQNYVEVFGHGGQLAGFDVTTHEDLYAVVYAVSNDSPFYYSLPHSGPTTKLGVQGAAYVIDDVLDRQQAQFMANWLRKLSNQWQIRIMFSTYCDVRPGQTVWIYNPIWPYEGPIRVIDVDNEIREGMMIRNVTCGWPKLDAKSIATGPYARLLQNILPIGSVSGNTRGLTPGTPGFQSISTRSNSKNQNTLQTRYDNQGNGRIRVPASVSNRNEHNQPLANEVFKYYRDLQTPGNGVGGLDTDPQKKAAAPTATWMFSDIFGLYSDWYNPHDGTNHPVHLLYEFVDDEWQSPLMPDPATFVELRLTEIDETRNIVTGVESHVTVNMELARPGTTKVVLTDLPSRDHPFTVKYGDVLHIQVLNIPAGHKVVMFLSERLPLTDGRTVLPTAASPERYSPSP